MRGNPVRKVELSNLRRKGTPRLWVGDSNCNQILRCHPRYSGHVVARLDKAALILAQFDLCQPVVNNFRILFYVKTKKIHNQLIRS